MTVKYTPFNKDYQKKNKIKPVSKYSLLDKYASANRPVELPLAFKNLKPNTKYQLFLKNNDGTNQEDITRFSKPYGESLKENNGATTYNSFTSNREGKLFLLARPYGTDTIDPATKNWVNHWKYADNKQKNSDFGRENFILVETSRVTAGSVTDKIKVVPDSVSAIINPTRPSQGGMIQQNIVAEYIQSFFVDPNNLGNSKTIDVTDITLYFRNKPNRNNNNSGLYDPGVTVFITDMENNIPNIESQYQDSIVDRSWSQITTSSDGSVGTVFSFKEPVRLQAGKFYCIGISVDDDEYILWNNVKGDVLVGTNDISPGSSKEHRGDLYLLTNAKKVINNSNFNKVYSTNTKADIKFDVHVAEYDTTDLDINLVHLDYEFLTIKNTSENFHGSEFIYQETANSTGTIDTVAGQLTVTGSNTTFSGLSENDKIVAIDGANVDVLIVDVVESNTALILKERATYTMSNASFQEAPIGVVDHYDYNNIQLFLRNSNATASKKFTANSTIIGVESGETATIASVDAYPLSTFSTDFNVEMPSSFDMTGVFNLGYDDSGTYRVSNTSNFEKSLNLFQPNHINKYSALLLSKSIEVDNITTIYDSDGDGNGDKSSQIKLSFVNKGSSTTSYSSPTIDLRNTALATKYWDINNDSTNEHTNYGNSVSKHISEQLTFGEDQSAEDIRVIYNAYKPPGTDFKVYAKILNSEDPDAFDDKSWTELEYVSGQAQVSDVNDSSDFREFEFGFPAEIPTDATLDGVFASANTDTLVITGTGTTFTASTLEAGDVIKLYDPLFANTNYGFFSVDSANATSGEITLTEAPDEFGSGSEVGVASFDGYKVDTTSQPRTAYNNPLNDNVVRYFGETGESYDTYDAVAIKTVLLSSDYKVVPKIDDYRVIGVSV